MFTPGHLVEGMLYLKAHANDVYSDKIENMRNSYHEQKMTDDAGTFDMWERQDRQTEMLFLALGESLSEPKPMKFPKYL